ncbi:hypothetical protein ABIC74_000817 [Mucilaginibacter rubeus]|uniref:hypothetical protein n=1 Tax=Mucilaginibacter rubeus TaxID=2027860 RepID=UPI0033926B1E
MKSSLFDDFERIEINRDDFLVEHYTFLNTSAIPEAVEARVRIDSWSEGFPINDEFLKRFRSKNNKQHAAAFFELFIFHYFKSNGFAIQCIERDKKPTPDFMVEINGENVFIECTCSSNSGIDEIIDKLQSTILDSFKKIDKRKHFINIDWLVSSNISPSLKRIRHLIREYICEESRSPALIIDDAGWKIKITLLPASNDVSRGVGILRSPVQMPTPHLNVLTALNDKRPSKYQLSSPYIIALYSEDMFLNYLDMELALFDRARFQDKLPVKRGKDKAFFIAKQHLTNSSVSAVLLVQRLTPYSSETPKMKLFNHPEPKFSFNNLQLKIAQWQFNRIDDDTFQIMEVQSQED